MAQSTQMLFTRGQKAVVAGLSLLLIAGEYKNFIDLSVGSYKLFVSAFTDRLDHQQLAHSQIGITKSYIQSKIGSPKFIRQSKNQANTQFEYYFQRKYLLMLAYDKQRLACYSVTVTEPTFTPDFPINAKKLQQPVNDLIIGQPKAYRFAGENYVYGLIDLGNSKLTDFNYLTVGRVEYNQDHEFNHIAKTIVKAQIDNQTQTLALQAVVFGQQQSNFYALCEWPFEFVDESVLSVQQYDKLK